MFEAALIAVPAAYGAVVLAFWLLQDRMVFYPPAPGPLARAPDGWRIESIRHRAGDGIELSGVLLIPPGPPRPLIAYYGGNAEEVTAYAGEAESHYGKRAVLLMNYRGFGASAGRPSERALVDDAIHVIDRVARSPDVDGTRLAVHGRSLGSGVAVQVAAARATRCVVLTSPFDSARAVASSMYPWLPVRALLRHPFESLARAPGLHIPALFIAGSADTLVAPSHSERLARAWGGPVDFVVLHGRNHGDLSLDPAYAGHLRTFLDRHH